jgi:DNA polymerase-3 subunit epsilon
MMHSSLQLQRPLVSIDLETTGLNVQNDRIVEISCVKIFPDGQRQVRPHRCNPGIPICAAATAVHGLSDADVAHQPPFSALAAELFTFLQGADLTGFNIKRFDLPLLKREFERVNKEFPQQPVHIIDSLQIFYDNEPRDLSAAHKLYCGTEMQDAHSAEADAQAAANILLAQLEHYPTLPKNVAELHAYCHKVDPNFIDPDGKIIWVDDRAALGFGKYKHRPLQVLVEEDPEYLRWMAGANFSEPVVTIVRAALAGKFPLRQSA